MKKLTTIIILFFLFGCGSQKHENPFSPSNLNIYSITPTGVKANSGDKEISLSWDILNDDFLDSYKIYRSLELNGVYKEIANVKKTVAEYRDSDLLNGTKYFYRLTAINVRNVEGNPAETIFATPKSNKNPSTPKNFKIESYDKKSFLYWDYNIESDLIGYYIYRNNLPKGEYQKIASVSKEANNFNDTGLINGNTYYYKITAYNLVNMESLFSTTQTALPFSAKIKKGE